MRSHNLCRHRADRLPRQFTLCLAPALGSDRPLALAISQIGMLRAKGWVGSALALLARLRLANVHRKKCVAGRLKPVAGKSDSCGKRPGSRPTMNGGAAALSPDEAVARWVAASSMG